MSGRDEDADTLRAEAERARRLAATLTQSADRARLIEYASELERRANQAQSVEPQSSDSFGGRSTKDRASE